MTNLDPLGPGSNEATSYTVVARRYRPKSFSELVGQEHIGQALSKAISTGRVGHAYLFTGARGVGKTSSARIFAKALNAPESIAAGAASNDDIADAIDHGEDVDVIEIDGASNRGIDEIRQLRANVSVRPSRSRYKIYIIDEVHMLTQQAFNALLKTLEEPPEHVKFIFCTTDPEKIPITVLSRCQRFDFAPVQTDAIQGRLSEICKAEGFEADEEALAMLARRAAGSMRDSQSLLEQVMSFSSGRITLEQVNSLLGTADEGRLKELTELLVDRRPADVLRLVTESIAAGTDSGQLAEQLLSYFRDLMAVAVGGGRELLKLANPANYDALRTLADRWGLQSILTAVGLLDEALVRMRHSVQSQALLEVALIQITQLHDLGMISKLLEAMSKGGPLPAIASATGAGSSPSEKKNGEPAHGSQGVGLYSGENPLSKKTVARELDARNSSSQSNSIDSSPRSELTDGHAGRGNSTTSPSSLAVQENPSVPVNANGQQHGAPNAVTPRESTQAIVDREQGSIHPTTSQPEGRPNLPSPAAVRESAATQATGSSVPTPSSPDSETLSQWKQAVSTVDGMLADFALMAVDVEWQGNDHWVIVFPPGHQRTLEYCEVPQRKQALQEAVAISTGKNRHVSFRVQPGQLVKSKVESAPSASIVRSQMMRQMAEHPFVHKVCEVLHGEIVRVDPPQKVSPPVVAALGEAEE